MMQLRFVPALMASLCLVLVPGCESITTTIEMELGFKGKLPIPGIGELTWDFDVKVNVGGQPEFLEGCLFAPSSGWAWAYDDDFKCIPGTRTKVNKGKNCYDDIPLNAVHIMFSKTDLGECPDYQGDGNSALPSPDYENPYSVAQLNPAEPTFNVGFTINGNHHAGHIGKEHVLYSAKMLERPAEIVGLFWQARGDLLKKISTSVERYIEVEQLVYVAPREDNSGEIIVRVLDENESIERLTVSFNGEVVLSGSAVSYDSGAWGYEGTGTFSIVSFLPSLISKMFTNALETTVRVDLSWLQGGVLKSSFIELAVGL